MKNEVSTFTFSDRHRLATVRTVDEWVMGTSWESVNTDISQETSARQLIVGDFSKALHCAYSPLVLVVMN